MEITELLNNYFTLNNEIEKLTEQKEETREQILAIFKKNNWKDYKDDQFIAKVSSRNNYKFTDKVHAVEWLKNNGYANFIKEDIDTSLNKELKSNNVALTEGLKGMFQSTETKTLKVDKV